MRDEVAAHREVIGYCYAWGRPPVSDGTTGIPLVSTDTRPISLIIVVISISDYELQVSS
jgi:hypothetical protein